MKKLWITLVSVLGGLLLIMTAFATVMTVLMVKERKKRVDEEIEQYLDGSIQ